MEVARGDLPAEYARLLIDNPLLARIEGTARSIGWTDLEIRALQLITAVRSNASLQARIAELESNQRRT